MTQARLKEGGPAELSKAGLEAFHPLCPASLSSGPPLCLAAGIGSTRGGPRQARTTCPGGNHSHLPPSLPMPSWVCPFLSIPSPPHTTPPPSCPSGPPPLSFFSFREQAKFPAPEAGMSGSHTHGCSLLVSWRKKHTASPSIFPSLWAIHLVEEGQTHTARRSPGMRVKCQSWKDL